MLTQPMLSTLVQIAASGDDSEEEDEVTEDETIAVDKPTQDEDKIKSKDRFTKYYRLRKIRMINGKYLTCTCGYQRRMKAPCAHTVRVTSKRCPLMCHVHWWMLFQCHCKRKVGGS